MPKFRRHNNSVQEYEELMVNELTPSIILLTYLFCDDIVHVVQHDKSNKRKTIKDKLSSDYK